MAKLISNIYAEALFELAAEENKIDDLYAQIDMLEKLFSENPDFIKLLTHPQITVEEKIATLEKTLKGRVDDEIVGLLRVVTTKDRAGEIGAIFDNFRAKVYDHKKIGVVYVSSATGLNEAQKKREMQKRRLVAFSLLAKGRRKMSGCLFEGSFLYEATETTIGEWLIC